jgi:hypothetical protein
VDVFDGPTSHTPTPESTQIVAVTANHCAMPPAMARKPNTRNGTVLASRCGQPPCSSGAQMMPPRPGQRAGHDAFAVERLAGELVDQLDHVQQRCEGQHDERGDHRVRRQHARDGPPRGGRRGDHATEATRRG